MLQITTKKELAAAARTLAESYKLILFKETLFAPVNWQTQNLVPELEEETIWLPLDRKDLRTLGNREAFILFSNDSEITNFIVMLKQYAQEILTPAPGIFVHDSERLMILNNEGNLVEPDGRFRPNFIKPAINTDKEDNAFVHQTVVDWLNSEEEASSLLKHLSTILSSDWSAVKYVLLIGDGGNGKSVLLDMLLHLFGSENVSHVTRQQIAERLPVCTELNAKLLNIVFDGEMTYIKDSSVEKSLTAGEPTPVRLLFENGNTTVQTNALFIEGLNSEPKTRDKSGALQRRISRFFFPNLYPMDIKFHDKMMSEPMLGALLNLLLQHFVQKHEIASALKPTDGARALLVEQNLLNSPIHQFVAYLIKSDDKYLKKLNDGGIELDPLVNSFMSWRFNEGFSEYSTADVKKMFKQSFFTEWKSVRKNSKVTKTQVLCNPKPDLQALLDEMENEKNDAD